MTREQRKIIYYAAMFEIEAFGLRGAGICFALSMAIQKPFEDPNIERDYPELYAQRPKIEYGLGYWFRYGDYHAERLECLSRAIDLCEE